MVDETITFELIRKIQVEELKTSKLTKLPENFFENCKTYLENKRKLIEGKEDRKVALELKNIERLIEEIFNRRERKIINLAINSGRTNTPLENFTEEEKKFFEKISNPIVERRDDFLNSMFQKVQKEEQLIVFKEEVPEFVGIDLKTYGPFKKGDVAKIPKENMKVLLERGIAEEFKVPK